LVAVVLALIAPLFIDADVTNVVSGTGEKMAPPSLDDPLGTDESGRSVLLMISHDLSVLADVCDRLAVMYAGRLVEAGPSSGDFRHPYSQALAAAFPTVGDPASRLAPHGLAGDPPDPQQLPGGCSFHPRCPVALESCSSVAIELRPAGDRRTAACVLVGEDA
jgi:peptide/nickel transport system ATP-binding protein